MYEHQQWVSCVEVTVRLHPYLDRELGVGEMKSVQQHLEICLPCDCRFRFDGKLKRLIHDHCAFHRAPQQLREKVLRLAQGEQSGIDLD